MRNLAKILWALAALGMMATTGLWGLEVRRINAIATRDFGPRPCWFVPSVPARDPPRLQPGPRGIYFPNPLRQLNRRFLGFGIEDMGIGVPHFVLAAQGHKGAPERWAWSYWQQDFWSLDAADGYSRPGEPGLMDFAVGDAEILQACPDFPVATAERQTQGITP